MNREIKFRAWDIANQEFIPEIFFMDYKGNITQVDTGKELVDLAPDLEFVLQQYTGLKDRNGKEIYEGDIVKVGKTCSHVVFMLTSFRFNSYMEQGLIDNLYKASQIGEVVGNIYENIELLRAA